MDCRIEHANLCVRDIDATIRFLLSAFPSFRVRRDAGRGLQRWVHVGDDETYFALTQAMPDARPWVPYSGQPGVNHVACEVGDVEALRLRLKAGGYAESTVSNAHPHRKRIYFHDPEGNDWEFVQYFSDDPAKRNDYDLPDV
jgi:catechol 2,3-dioxygenase-like lactoylglutathione lyase family enzyme